MPEWAERNEMKAVFEWSASDKLLREELIATGIAGKVNRYVEIDMQQLDTDTRRRIVALAGSISSDPLRIRSNEAIKPDAVASTRARGDNGLSRISLYFDQEPTMEEALVAAERFIAGMALVRVADRGYRAEKGIVGCTHRVLIPATDGLKQLRKALLSNYGSAAMAQIWFYDNGDVVLECGIVSEKTAARIYKATNKRKAILWPSQETFE